MSTAKMGTAPAMVSIARRSTVIHLALAVWNTATMMMEATEMPTQ